MWLISGKKEDVELDVEIVVMLVDYDDSQIFNLQECRMIEWVLNFNQCIVSSIMMLCYDIEYIDFNVLEVEICVLLEKNQYMCLVVMGENEQEDLFGVVYVIDLL